MRPLRVSADVGKKLDAEVLGLAARILESGGLVVYPASTLYGLGASIHSARGIEAVLRAKRRPGDMPLSVIAGAEQLDGICRIDPLAAGVLQEFAWGITLVVEAAGDLHPALVRDGKVAVRLASTPLLLSLVDAVGPLTGTSANIHGGISPADVDTAMEQLGGLVGLYIDAGSLKGAPSTLVDLTGPRPKIIRLGAVSEAEILSRLDPGRGE